MSDVFLAEIRIFPFNFAPTGWAQCDGQLLPISQNTALFSLLGTQYGGDGKSNFALPNLQGAAPLGAGQGPGLQDRFIGEVGGETSVSLIQGEMPIHGHTVVGTTNPATQADPGGAILADSNDSPAYAPAGALTALNPESLTASGGSQPHNNLQPYLILNFCIALQGIFPSRA